MYLYLSLDWQVSDQQASICIPQEYQDGHQALSDPWKLLSCKRGDATSCSTALSCILRKFPRRLSIIPILGSSAAGKSRRTAHLLKILVLYTRESKTIPGRLSDAVRRLRSSKRGLMLDGRCQETSSDGVQHGQDGNLSHNQQVHSK